MSKKITHKEALEIQDRCIERGVNADETIELLKAIKKARDVYGSKCINLDETIKENTGKGYFSECFTIRFCDGSHAHYLPSENRITRLEPSLGEREERAFKEFMQELGKHKGEREKKKGEKESQSKEVEIPLPV